MTEASPPTAPDVPDTPAAPPAPPADSDAPIPRAVIAPKRRWSLSLVWIIPVVAALIGGWIAVQTYLSKGPTITISFKTAEGMEAGKTKIRYKNVDIGDVVAIALSDDRTRVVATAQMTPQARKLLVEDTRFWVVRPRIGPGGISGLSTLLGGSYIGVDVGHSEEEERNFVALETPPVITTDSPGRQYVLHADEIGSLDIGSPIYFRHIQVGQIVSYALDKDGRGLTLRIFVYSPYDQYVTTNTRFWHASGINVSLDANGVKLNTESLVTILAGGIAFQNPPDQAPAPLADANASFALAANLDAALKQPDRVVERFLLYFSDSLHGLSVGAQVDFRGIVVGEVTALSVEYDRESKILRFPVEINIYPERLRSRYRSGAKPLERADVAPVSAYRAILDRLVERGMRAQLKSGNLLTGQLYVGLDFIADTPKNQIDWARQPAILPTAPGSLQALQESIGDIARKIDKLPIEQIGANLQAALQSLNTTLQTTDRLMQRVDKDIAPELRATLEETRKTMNAAQHTLSADAPLQQDARDTLRELARAAASLRTLTDYLERHPEALIQGKKEEKP